MNSEKQKKRQSLKVIVSEAIMVLTVVVTVIILALVVSGYWINSDFKVERQGMLQISSVPTGANVNIDGEPSSWLQRTNTSKVLPSGEHTVVLTKDGYDSWSKTIKLEEGLLYRLHYPRLFLQDRTKEKVLSTTGTTVAVISSNHNSLLLANETTKWHYINLDSEKLEPKSLDISSYFSGVSLAEDANKGLFTGEILDANWDYDATHVLFKVKNGDQLEWVLLDVKNIENSINLSREFDDNFSIVKILNNSSSNLLAVQDGNLRKIDVAGRSISASLAKNVIDFDHYENEIVFSALNTKEKINETEKYYIGFFKVGDSQITELIKTPSPVQAVISKFYDKKYITTLSDNLVTVYEVEDPTVSTNYELSFAPQIIEVGHDGEFITMYTGTKIATLDMEAKLVREWAVEGDNFGWIDNDMIYTVKDGELIVYDFDGYNRRVLAKNTSNHFPAGITDNKWLYYFSDDNLVREWLIAH